MATPQDHDALDPKRCALIVYDMTIRAFSPSDPIYAQYLRENRVLENWIELVTDARKRGIPVIYTTPVSRADGADIVHVLTDLSAETGVPPLTNGIEGTPQAQIREEIAPLASDYFFFKRRPSAFYGTGVAELLHMLRKDTIVIGGVATNRGVETTVREAFSLDLNSVVVRDCCGGGNLEAHNYSLNVAMKMYARIRDTAWVLDRWARPS